MARTADFYVFERKRDKKTEWSVYYFDENGKKLPAISLNRLKKEIYVGKKRLEPVKDEKEALRVAQKALSENCDLVFSRRQKKSTSSKSFADYVEELWDFDTSSYIQNRLKEGNTILRKTCDQNRNAFLSNVAVFAKNITLADIDKTNGTCLTLLRDNVIELDISSSTKNKAFQTMRTALEYAYQRGVLKGNYKDKLKNTKPQTEGADAFRDKELNDILNYYYKNTEKGTYERYVYLISILCATTALRPNEVRALKKTDLVSIDKKNKCAILYIDHAINSDGEYDKRKNDKPVYVATYIPVIEEILDFAKNNPNGEDYCFWDRNHPEKPMTHDYFKNIPNDCFAEVGIKSEGRKLTFYSLRKNAASIARRNTGYSSALLGHSDTYVTEKHYIKSSPEEAVVIFKEIKKVVKLPE